MTKQPQKPQSSSLQPPPPPQQSQQQQQQQQQQHQNQQNHGHSHGNGQTCHHNHGNNGDDNDEHGHNHSGPTQIPYYVVSFIIFSVYLGFLCSHFIFETRPSILNQGRNGHGYNYPEFFDFITQPRLRFALQIFLNFTPFTLHPLQWLTFLFISTCFFVSFFRVTYTNPGCVDPEDPVWGFHKQPQQTQLLVQHQLTQYHQNSILPPTIERKHNGSRRYCRKLNVFKPDRAHFCHATGRLVKRLDHHCIFLKASVGYNNHKYFILFLFWLIVLAAFIGIKMIIPMKFVWGINSMQHLLLNVIVGCFGAATSLALCAFLGFHLWLIQNSLTTLETGEKYNKIDIFTGTYLKSPFNVSFLLNFQQIFGRGSILGWFLPVTPFRSLDDDGTIYPISHLCPPGLLHNQ